MSSGIRLSVNVYAQSEYCSEKNVEFILKMLVPTDIFVSTLIEQIVIQNDPTADYTKYGLVLSGQGKWLQGFNTVTSYNLKDGDVLDLLYKRKKIKVKTLDGSVRTVLIDETLTAGMIVEGICARLGINNYEEYALMLEGFPDEEDHKDKKNSGVSLGISDNTRWLHSGRLLREQRAFEAKSIILKRRFFFNHENVDASDPFELNLLYSQIQILINNGQSPCTLPIACMFAATQLQIEMGDYCAEKFKNFDIQPKRLLPFDFAKIKDIKKLIFAEYAKLNGMSQMDAKLRYFKLFKSLPTCGATFFAAEIIESSKKNIPVFLGVSRTKIIILDIETRKKMSEWSLQHMRRWSVLFNTLTIDLGDYADTYVRLRCVESETVSDLIFGYINILLKRHQLKGYKKLNNTKTRKIHKSKYYSPDFKTNTGEDSDGSRCNNLNDYDDVNTTDSSLDGFCNDGSRGVINGRNKKLKSTVDDFVNDEKANAKSFHNCDNNQFEACISNVTDSVKATNRYFKLSELGSSSRADSQTGGALLCSSSSGVSQKGIISSNDLNDVLTVREVDEHAIVSDLALTVVEIPETIVHTGLHRFDKKSVDVNSVRDNINTLLHSQASFVRSFRSIMSSGYKVNKADTDLLIKCADKFFLCVESFTDRLESVYVDKFSFDEYKLLASKLTNSTIELLKSLGKDIINKECQERIAQKNDEVISLLHDFVSSVKEATDTISADGNEGDCSELEFAMKRFKFSSLAPLAFTSSLAIVTDNFHVENYLKNCFKTIKKELGDIVADLESKNINPGTMDHVRKCADDLLNKYLCLCQMLCSAENDVFKSHLEQFRFVCNYLDSLLSDNLIVSEFADNMNELSLSTMNLFNSPLFFENMEDSKEIVEKLNAARKKVGTTYSTVMACAREYASNMSSLSLREDLVNSMSQLKSVMQETMSGGLRSCIFYDVYSSVKNLFDALGYLVSYCRTSLIPRYANNEYPELYNEISQFSASYNIIYSAINSYNLQPTSYASQIYLVEAAKVLIDRAIPLITAASELSVTCVDPNIKGLIQKSSAECTNFLNILQDLLSNMHNYPTKIRIKMLIEQLDSHINDLLMAKEKASLLVNLKGYNIDVAYSDFQNSLKYARVSNGQLALDLRNGSIQSASSTVGYIINVLQCVSFATLGVCSAINDVPKRIKNIECVYAYANLLREILIDMDKAIDNPSLCAEISDKYAPQLKDALRKLFSIFQTGEKLVDAYELSSMVMNVDDMLTYNGASTNSLSNEEITTDILSSAKKLSIAVNKINESVKESTVVQQATYDELYDTFRNFADVSINYLATETVNNKEDRLIFAKDFIGGLASDFNSLVGTVIDQNCDDNKHKVAKGIEYYSSSLENSLRKCISAFEGGVVSPPKNLLCVKEFNHSLDKVIDTVGSIVPNQSSYNRSTDNAAEFYTVAATSLNNTFQQVTYDIKEALDRTVKSLECGNSDSKQINEDMRRVVNGTVNISHKMVDFVKAVEENTKSNNTPGLVNGILDVDVIRDVMNSVNDMSANIENTTLEKILADSKKVNANCDVLNYMCKETLRSPQLRDEDRDAILGYCKGLDVVISNINENVNKLNISPDDEVSKVKLKENITEANTLANEIYVLARTPKMCGTYDDVNGEVYKSQVMLSDLSCKLVTFTKRLVDSVGECLVRNNSNSIKEVNREADGLLEIIKESNNAFINFTPVHDEYDQIRNKFVSIEEKYRTARGLDDKVSNEPKTESSDKPQKMIEDELIDLTKSDKAHDYFGILDPKNATDYFNGRIGELGLSPLYNTSELIDLIKLNEIVKNCENLSNCVISGEGDVIKTLDKVYDLYENFIKSNGVKSNELNTKSGTNAYDKKLVYSFKEDVIKLIDSCRDMLAHVSVADRNKPDTSSIIMENLANVNESYGQIVKDCLNTYKNNTNKDLLKGAIEIMASKKAEKRISIRKIDEEQIQADLGTTQIEQTEEGVRKNDYVESFFDYKSYLDKFVAEAAHLGNKFSSKPAAVLPMIERLFKSYSQLNDKTELVHGFNSDPNITASVSKLTRHMGFILFRMLDIQKSWAEGRISDTKANQELYDSSSELVKYLNEHHSSFKEFVKFIDLREEVMEVADSNIKKIEDKMDQCKKGQLNPIDFDGDSSRDKEILMEKSIKVVEKINNFLEICNGKDINVALKKAMETLDVLSVITDSSLVCAASLTPLNNNKQLQIVNCSYKVANEYRDLVESALSDVYTRMNIANGVIVKSNSNKDEKAFSTFQAIKELISSVNRADAKQDEENAIDVVENSKKIIEKSVNSLENGTTVSSFGGGAALTSILNYSRELSDTIPDFIKKLTQLGSSQPSEYTPIVNKFTNGVENLVKAASAATIDTDQNNENNLLKNIVNFCQKSIEILDTVKDFAADNADDPDDNKLEDATKNINLAIFRVAQCAESRIKSQSAEERNHPMNIAEQELWTVRDTMKDVYQHLNASDNVKNTYDNIEADERSFASEINREIRNIIMTSLSISREVYTAHRSAGNVILDAHNNSPASKSEMMSNYSTLVFTAKKFSFMTINLCQQSSVIGMDAADVHDLVASCRGIFVVLNSLKRLIEDVSAENVQFYRRVMDAVKSAQKSLDKLISIGNSSLALDKAEDLISNSLLIEPLPNSESFDFDNKYGSRSVKVRSDGIVKERIEEIDAKLKVIRIEKELEDARIGLGRIRKRIYNKDKSHHPSPVVS